LLGISEMHRSLSLAADTLAMAVSILIFVLFAVGIVMVPALATTMVCVAMCLIELLKLTSLCNISIRFSSLASCLGFGCSTSFTGKSIG